MKTQWKNISEHFYRMIQEYISNLIMLTYWILDMSPFNVFSQSALSGKGHVTEWADVGLFTSVNQNMPLRMTPLGEDPITNWTGKLPRIKFYGLYL